MELIHGTSVNWHGQGVLIIGPSGSGKSGLALGLMAHGAGLICDDQTRLIQSDGAIFLHPAPNLLGMIEARGTGILNAEASDPAPLTLVIDMGTPETDRLPPQRTTKILGHPITLLRVSASQYFLQALVHYLKSGRKH